MSYCPVEFWGLDLLYCSKKGQMPFVDTAIVHAAGNFIYCFT